mgnify:CR=1 FL=1|jgi:hypothetical protein
MPRIVHFEIPADEPERAVKFYENVFGWQINKWGREFSYWLIKTGEKDEPGIDGAIMLKNDFPVVRDTISVDSVDECIEKIQEEGGEIAMPKKSIPGVGSIAFFRDTEENIFGIIEMMPME